MHQYDPQTATSLAVNNFHICRISFDGPQWVVIDVVVEETNAARNCFGAKKENKVTPRRGHYQQYDPYTIILLKGFFLLTALGCAPENSNGLERRMRRTSFRF